MRKHTRVSLALGIAVAVMTVALACDVTDNKIVPTPTPESVSAPQAAVIVAAVLPPEPDLGSGVEGGVEDFDITDMEWQGYWYSRYNLLTLSVASGLGIPFMPPQERMQAAMQMVAQNPADPVHAPDNIAPLRAVYAGGDASLLQDITKMDPNDASMFRFDPDRAVVTVTTAAQALSSIKQIEWVRNFSFPDHFGAPSDDFGATERFRGIVMSVISSQHSDYALKEMKREDGWFYDSDGALDVVGNWWLLLNFVDKAAISRDPKMLGNDPPMAAVFESAARDLHMALRSREIFDTRELAAAIQALVWHAAFTPSQEDREMAIGDILRYGDLLLDADTGTPTLKAVALRELIEASRLSTDARYMNRASELLDDLVRDFDFDQGYFRSQRTYTVDDIAYIVGGLNAVRFHADTDDAIFKGERMLLAFWESAVNMSGLILSAPPGKAMGFATAYEQDLRELSYRYPTTPPPAAAGGEFGKAPVFASEVSMRDKWTVTNPRFDSAGAMHLSNEALWLHAELGVDGFPAIPR